MSKSVYVQLTQFYQEIESNKDVCSRRIQFLYQKLIIVNYYGTAINDLRMPIYFYHKSILELTSTKFAPDFRSYVSILNDCHFY